MLTVELWDAQGPLKTAQIKDHAPPPTLYLPPPPPIQGWAKIETVFAAVRTLPRPREFRYWGVDREAIIFIYKEVERSPTGVETHG